MEARRQWLIRSIFCFVHPDLQMHDFNMITHVSCTPPAPHLQVRVYHFVKTNSRMACFEAHSSHQMRPSEGQLSIESFRWITFNFTFGDSCSKKWAWLLKQISLRIVLARVLATEWCKVLLILYSTERYLITRYASKNVSLCMSHVNNSVFITKPSTDCLNHLSDHCRVAQSQQQWMQLTAWNPHHVPVQAQP